MISLTKGKLDLPAGTHTYTFACALPPQLPTSFEGTYGQIRYTARVILERPWKFDQTYKVAFTVLKELDLNRESPLLRVPTQMEYMRSFCCWPCRSGPLSMVATLPQSGFVPGQTVPVSVSIVNASNVTIDYVRFTLRKTIAYHSQAPSFKTKLEVETIQEQRVGGVAALANAEYAARLVVPPVPASNGGQCRVIDVSYEVKVEAKTSGPHQSPFVLVPVTIGTRPLTENATGGQQGTIAAAAGGGGHLMTTDGLQNYGFEHQPQGDCGVVTNPLAVDGAAAGFGQMPSAPEIVTPTPLPQPRQMEFPAVAAGPHDMRECNFKFLIRVLFCSLEISYLLICAQLRRRTRKRCTAIV